MSCLRYSIRDRFFGSLDWPSTAEVLRSLSVTRPTRSQRSSPSEPAKRTVARNELAGMRRLIDSDRSPASPLLVSHPCSYRRGRSVGAFSSVRRAGHCA